VPIPVDCPPAPRPHHAGRQKTQTRDVESVSAAASPVPPPVSPGPRVTTRWRPSRSNAVGVPWRSRWHAGITPFRVCPLHFQNTLRVRREESARFSTLVITPAGAFEHGRQGYGIKRRWPPVSSPAVIASPRPVGPGQRSTIAGTCTDARAVLDSGYLMAQGRGLSRHPVMGDAPAHRLWRFPVILYLVDSFASAAEYP